LQIARGGGRRRHECEVTCEAIGAVCRDCERRAPCRPAVRTRIAADEGTKPVTLAYDCHPQDGTGRASVEISAEFPATGEVGRPVQPGPATVTLVLSRTDIDGLLPAGADAVVSTATLTVKVVQNDRSAEATWADLSAPGTPLPTDGEVRLVHSGEVPSVTVGAPGDVSLIAEGGYCIRIDSLGNLKLPDAESTFLAFGFQAGERESEVRERADHAPSPRGISVPAPRG
jgi:hypothetical protein